MNLNTAFKKEKEYIKLNAPSMEMYIPMDFFENNLAEDNGDIIKVFGLVHTQLFDKDNKPNGMEILNIPTSITISPSSTERSSMVLNEGEEPQKVLICRFIKEDNVMRSTIAKDAGEVEKFVNMMLRGKVPRMPYNKIISVWQKNLQMNGVGLGVPSSILEMIISEVYRNKEKPEESFRFKISKNPNTDQLGYITANMRQICAKNSTFAALTFEDIDSMIVSSLNRSIYNKEEAKSPLEKIIKY